MVCSSCGAEIADKAIVCYRCGTPTAIPATPERKPTPRRPLWPAIVAVLVIVALAAWAMSMTAADSGARYAAYGAMVCAMVFLAVRLLKGRT